VTAAVTAPHQAAPAGELAGLLRPCAFYALGALRWIDVMMYKDDLLSMLCIPGKWLVVVDGDGAVIQ
jgi:hypothetical protein